jgi:chorismate synthase
MNRTDSNLAVEIARQRFDPAQLGFQRAGETWRKRDEFGEIAVASLNWSHEQTPSFVRRDGRVEPIRALSFLVEAQRITWGIPPEDLVPANLLAIIPDTGGAILVAYDPAIGFNSDGWLGFVFGAGSSNGVLVSHMLGVNAAARGRRNIGWYLKIFQAESALATGHTSMIWTFDPMRGANARLNLEKLAATVCDYTIDKYGSYSSKLYGNVPSDRFTANWNLAAERTWDRLAGDGGSSNVDIDEIVEADPSSVDTLVRTGAPRLRVRVPGDIDTFAADNPLAANEWRARFRATVARMLDTKQSVVEDPPSVETTRIVSTHGDYVIDGFVRGADGHGHYLFSRKTEE